VAERGRGIWEDDDRVIDISKHRLSFEFVLERRGSNAVAKYGHVIAWRWLLGLGVNAERHHVLNLKDRRIMPDLFDPITKTVFEVKTGYLYPSKLAQSQACGYQETVRTRQAREVIYLDVAFMNRIGMSHSYRLMLEECGHRYLFLT